MEFSLHLDLCVPNFWRWLFPTYREGYRAGLEDGRQAAAFLVRVSRRPEDPEDSAYDQGCDLRSPDTTNNGA